MTVWQNPDSELKTWQPPPKKKESLKEKVLRYGVKGPIAASLGAIHKGYNLPSNIASALGDQTSADILSVGKGFNPQALMGLPEEQNFADMAIQAIPEIAGAIALPEANLGKLGSLVGQIPKGGKYLKAILQQSIPQAGYAGLMSENGQRGESAAIAGGMQAPFAAASQLMLSPKPALQKLGSYILGGGLGAATGFGLNQAGFGPTASTLGGAVVGAAGKKFVGSKAMMMDELARGVDPAKVERRLAAADRLGLDYLTPAEASRSPFLAKKQGQLGRTEEGAEHLYEKAHQRVASEEKSINELLDTIYHPENHKAEKDALYAIADKTKTPPGFEAAMRKNAVIKNAEKTVKTDKAYAEQLRKIPKDTLQYWDLVKRALDDQVNAFKRAGNDSKASLISEERKKLRASMDAQADEYGQARALSEREKARKTLEKAFDRTDINSGAAFFKSLASKKKFDEVMGHLRNVPEAQSKLRDMRELFRDFSPIPNIKTTRGLESTGMLQNRNDVNQLQQIIENMFSGGKLDKQAIDFITSKDWEKQLAEINKISDKQKRMAKIIEVFGKGVSRGSSMRDEG